MFARHKHITNMLVEFAIPGKPVAWARPAQARNGHRFTQPEARAYSSLVKQIASEAMGDRPPVVGPVEVFLVAVLPIAPSWPQWRRTAAIAGRYWPDKKPDADNLIKGIADAMNCIVFADDRQIVHVSCLKEYGLRPGVHVSVGIVLQADRQSEGKRGKIALAGRYRPQDGDSAIKTSIS
jgi:Holliday junction resolvase RusA-like endonuclease